MANPTRTEMIEAVRLPDEHSEHTFGALISYLISQAFDRVETLNREATHRYYTQCKLCGGTDEQRGHYKTLAFLVKHGGACSLAAHLERLRTIAAHPAILRELEAGGWRPIAKAPTNMRILVCSAFLSARGASLEYVKKRWSWIADNGEEVGPTHWQPLPSPPTTSDGGEG